ncbi:MAG: SagB/ThcOx family dehydrogenase [Candidatus Omnitrophota bacterium]
MNIKAIIVSIVIFTIACQSAVCAQDPGVIILPEPKLNGGKLLMQALKGRESSRAFSATELPAEVLSGLLWAADGVNRPESGKRTAPSAMNCREITIYVALKQGLYLYDAENNVLQPVLQADVREHTGQQEFTQTAPVNLIYVADFSRMRGDVDGKVFYSAVDTGFISQNVYLFCASEGLATVVLGWVDKPALEKIMKLKDDQKVILTQPVGYPAD